VANMGNAEALKKVVAAGGKAPRKAPKKPLWAGPSGDGVTFSLLSRYLVCKERFRLLAIDALAPADDFNHKIEYGNMWHVCEEAVAGDFDYSWAYALRKYAEGLVKKYRMASEQVEKWYQVCLKQFDTYLGYWKDHPDETEKEVLGEEVSFRIPYQLPSGRVVYLRGKFDSVDVIDGQLWLMEHKTKGDIKEAMMQRQLKFDLQTMLYLLALRQLLLFTGFGHAPTDALAERLGSRPIAGIRYNVVRRPLSGGKGNIVQHKPTKSNPQGETAAQFYDRLQEYFKEEPAHFFMRWHVKVDGPEMDAFAKRCLDPVLENLCDDYEWWDACHAEKGSAGGNRYDVWDGEIRRSAFPEHSPRHFVYPYGVYNVLAEGGTAEVDEYMFTGSEVGLDRVTNLFPELAA
jgi:hypothetical protein